MIYIGLTGWGDHEKLYPDQIKSTDKLAAYGSHFLTVEVDTSFYAIQPLKNAEKWARQTPGNFRFVVKAYQEITGHQRGKSEFTSKKELFEAFIESLQPYRDAGKLAMVLFQFPPWFDCKKEHVTYLRYCKKMMGEIPVALEFRHQSWFAGKLREETLQFMRKEGWIHAIVDEPQAGKGSAPTVLEPTTDDVTLVRMHGRNVHGWTKSGNANWRKVRYLYRYNQEELLEWKERLEQLQQRTKDITILFNNNSGGDAADNAKQLQELLGIDYDGLAPRQLGLF